MNQILSTKLNNKTFYEKKRWFKFQFTFSILIMIILILCGAFYLHHLERKEDFSSNLISNYNIYRLYNNTKNDDETEYSSDLFRYY